MLGGRRHTQDGATDAVDVWVQRATRGLCDEARQRIGNEIRGHYADAIQEALDQGMPKQRAAQTALAPLGNPRKARRGFLNTNLTKHQSWLLNQVITWKGWKRRIYLYFLPLR